MKLDSGTKDIIEEYLDEERLKRMIQDTSIIAWERKIEMGDIESWLNNFDGSCLENVKDERKIALWLLAHFTFYPLSDIRILCKELYQQYLHTKLLEIKGDIDENNIENTLKIILKDTLFLGLGNNSESGNNILYYFRQENRLLKSNFRFDLNKKFGNIVYIDDVTISGSQADTYIKSTNLKGEKQYFATLMATEEAINYIRGKNPNINVIAAMVLDEREKAFAKENHIFGDKKISNLKECVKEFCRYYGEQAIQGIEDMKAQPLGYGDGQYLIGFEHNTPNNTLPIFWGTGNGWRPLFKRYSKIYSWKEWKLDEYKYY